jgi:CDP-diglyceride synthetase
MGDLKSLLSNAAAVIYFMVVMLWLLLILIFAPIMLLNDIIVIRESGFSTSDFGTALIGVSGLFIGLSLLIPAFRKMYYKLPWMFPFVKIMYLNVVIMGIATMLLNYGYEVQNTSRHNQFFILMLCLIIICRALMCVYFDKKKVQYIGGHTNE